MTDEIDVLRALAHPVRWGILERLAAEPGICACDFTEFFDVSQPTISAHLKALRDAGLVTTQRQGTTICYCLASDPLARLADRLADMAAAAPATDQAARTQSSARRGRTAVPAPAAVPNASARRGETNVPAPAAAVPAPAVTSLASIRLADMAAMAQAAVPLGPARRSRTVGPAPAAVPKAPVHRSRTDGPAPAEAAED